MGTTRLVRFALHVSIDTPGRNWTASEWRVRKQGKIPGYGQPTAENIGKHVAHVEKSTQPGGVNSHIGPTKILRAWVVDQHTGDVVATWSAGSNGRTSPYTMLDYAASDMAARLRTMTAAETLGVTVFPHR